MLSLSLSNDVYKYPYSCGIRSLLLSTTLQFFAIPKMVALTLDDRVSWAREDTEMESH